MYIVLFWGLFLCFEERFTELFVAERFAEYVSSFERVLEADISDIEPDDEKCQGHQREENAPVEDAEDRGVQEEVSLGANPGEQGAGGDGECAGLAPLPLAEYRGTRGISVREPRHALRRFHRRRS